MHPSKSCQDPWEGGCLVLDLSRATLPGLPQGLGRGRSMVIAALDISILTFTFSRKTNADHPVAVPLRAGVCRADPGRVADGSQGLG